MRRIEEPDDGETITAEEALRRVSKWTKGQGGQLGLNAERLGYLLTDLKIAIFYLAHAQEQMAATINGKP